MKGPRNNYNNYNNSKDGFGKGSKSTALHYLLSTIPNEDNNDNTNTTKTKTTKEKIMLTGKNNAKTSNLLFLEESYFKTRYEELLNILLHDTSFYSDMFETKTDIHDIKKYYYQKGGNKIDDEFNTNQSSKIRFTQLYQKFQKKEKSSKKINRKNIITKNYNFENYIENLLFAEYISQILGIGESQHIIIDNNIYKISVGSIYEDLYYAGDIILEDQSGKMLSLDITLNQEKKSGTLQKTTDYFHKGYVVNYKIYQKDFQEFVKNYKQYISNQGHLPVGELRYSSLQIKSFEQRLSSILHQHNTPDSPD